MFEYLESISITEGEQIKKTIQALFRQTCILQVKYDPATLIKLIYKDKIMGEGLNAPVTTLKEMREYGKNTNLIVRKLKADEWKASLYLMRLHQIIDVPGAVRDVEDDTPIYIYSTINLYVTAKDMNDLIEEYREEADGYETAEENFYKNADQ